MLAFASARRAVGAQGHPAGDRAGLADHSPPIRVRIGLHTGEAIKDAEHFYGTTVHYAARVASHAVGGEVLARVRSTSSWEQGRVRVPARPGRRAEGDPGQHRLYALASR